MVDDGQFGDETEHAVAAAAAAWHLRLPSASADDWQAFTAWLEADPAHAATYDALALSDAELTDALSPADWSEAPSPANDREPPSRRRWMWGAAGVAAAAVVGLVLPGSQDRAVAMRVVETPPGVGRVVSLADGSRIELNGGTRVGIAEGKTRLVTLERGEAVFRVAHHEARPFVVQSGDTRLEDVGTVFNVSRVGPHLAVQVAEGSVLYQPDRDHMLLTAGAALSLVDGGKARLSGVTAADVGSWRQGRLVFRQTPVHLVAAAVERSTGSRIAVAPDLAETLFTGSIAAGNNSDRVIPRIAALLGARAVHRDGHWTLVREKNAGP